MQRTLPLFLALLPIGLLACERVTDCPECDSPEPEDTQVDTGDTGEHVDTEPDPTDLDGDGWVAPDDCNDLDPGIHPDALDVLDGADNNCDGVIDQHTLGAAHSKLLGEAAGDWAGANVAGLGDINGDGFDDIGVSAWYNDASADNAGALYAVLGPVARGTWSLANADVRLTGEAADDTLSRLIGAGDHNGDGLDDVLLCAQGEDTAENNAGAAYLLHGPLEGPWSLADADAKILGEARGDGVMRAVQGGDLDGDGQGDLLIGSPGDATYGSMTGAAYVVLGPASGTLSLANAHAKLTGINEGDLAGAFMVGPGDLNGDGYDDAVIGDHNGSHGVENSGSAYIIHGPITAGEERLTQAAAAAGAMFFGSEANGKAGKVAWAGDLTGDGAQDWLTTSFGDMGSSAFVFTGDQTGELNARDAVASVNWHADDATGVGDVNGDGFDDLLMAAAEGDTTLLFGPLLGTVDDHGISVVFPAEEADDYAGWRVACAGDTNGDGAPDMLIGAKSDDEAGTTAGAAYLVLGNP